MCFCRINNIIEKFQFLIKRFYECSVFMLHGFGFLTTTLSPLEMTQVRDDLYFNKILIQELRQTLP